MKYISHRFNLSRGSAKINDNLINVVELLKTDFQVNNKKYKTVGFFRKSPCHYLMLLNIVENSIVEPLKKIVKNEKTNKSTMVKKNVNFLVSALM